MNEEYLLPIATAVVIITVLLVRWMSEAEQKLIKLFLDWFPAILFAYVIPALFTHLSGLDLSKINAS